MSSPVSSSQSRRIYDFHGGIHPPEHKIDSNQSPIKQAPIAPQLVLPVQQHIGKPAQVLVAIGEHVLKGQRIAEADGFVSAHVHAPTSGTIIEIADRAVPHPSGMTELCVILAPDMQDKWCDLEPNEHYEKLSVEAIQSKIRSAGITGMGGAGFPTDIKVRPPQQDKVATLILNAAECEPYITADDRLMRERANDIVKGIEIIAYALQPGECLIGIEDNKPEAIAALNEAVKNTRIEVVVVPTKYPSGGEKQLIKLLTDKEVPSGRIPADIGIVCQNVATAAAIYRAVRFGEPLISRITTLTGQQFAQPGNVEVLLGTPISWLLSHYGYTPSKPERLIMGGPMMGYALHDTETPVVKTTNCILAPANDELPLSEQAQACIRCGLCAEACPAELLPQQLYWFARAQEHEKAEHHNLFDCIECGACSYVCPSSIPLVHYYRHAKSEIKQHRLDQQKSDRARIRFEARAERLEREQLEKEAKRKARAEAAAKAQAEKAKLEKSKNRENGSPDKTETVDPKQAAIEAALSRKKASQQEVTQNLDELKANWDKAQEKLEKMHDALDNAKENAPEQVEKLTRAVEKNQVRVNQAKQSFENAQTAKAEAESQPAQVAVAPPPDLAQLQTNVEKAEAKLLTMSDSLSQAKLNQPELVEKLERAVEKNKARVHAAQQALQDARSAQQQEES